MGQLVYNNCTIAKHSIYQYCHSFLNDVSNQDYPNMYNFDSKIECLDMDFYEQHVSPNKQASRTVDAVIGIQTYENNQAKDARLLLIELRMGYDNANNLDKTSMEQKVSHTIELLAGELTINRESFFIFNNNIAPSARSWFEKKRREGGIFRNCISCSVADFQSIVIPLPQGPISALSDDEEIKRNLHQEDITTQMFISRTGYWCKIATEYKNKWKLQDYKEIAGILHGEWVSFREQYPILTNEDEELGAEILEEDYPFLLGSVSDSEAN